MRHADRGRIAAQLRQRLQQGRIGSAGQQGGEQRIFLRARRIDFIDIAARGHAAEKIGTQDGAGDIGHALDDGDPLGRHAVPVRYGRL